MSTPKCLVGPTDVVGASSQILARSPLPVGTGLARRDALHDQLRAWDEAFGPVADEESAAARAVFDETDGVAVAVARGGGLVVTADGGDIARLATAVPPVRIGTSPAD